MVEEVGTEIFDGPNNSEEFFFPHRVVSFSGVKGARDEGNRTFTMVVFLSQDGTKGVVTCIGSENGLTRRVKDGEAVGGGNSGFEVVDGRGMVVCP